MSMDPHKWITFDKLSPSARQRIEAIYPYLKVEQCQFQEKTSGVFMKQGNSVKIEKLLDPARTPLKAQPATAAAAGRAKK
jgi:hypothetical protein